MRPGEVSSKEISSTGGGTEGRREITYILVARPAQRRRPADVRLEVFARMRRVDCRVRSPTFLDRVRRVDFWKSPSSG